MTKQELIDRVYRTQGVAHGVTKRAVRDVIDAVFAELGNYFVKAKVTRATSPKFTYPGFGTFTKKRREARNGRHPQTGALIKIPATHTVGFALGLDLKELINEK